MSLVNTDEINSLISLRNAIAIGYQPPAPRAALMHSITMADAILDQKRWPDEDKQRLAGLLEFFEAATPQVYKTAQELVEIVRRHGYESREGIRKTLDECITIAFHVSGDDFDIERDLEEAPFVEEMRGKYPHEFPGVPVPLKIEIGKTLARHGIRHRINSDGCNIVLSANTNGMAQINLEIDNGGKFGPLPVNFRLIPLALLYAHEFQGPALESSHHNRLFANGSMMDRFGRMPGHPSFNSATPPEKDPFGDMFSHLQVPLPGNDPCNHNPVLYHGRVPDQHGRLPGHPKYNCPTGSDQDPLNGTYPEHLQVPTSELKKLAQTWRDELMHKEMTTRTALQQKARPQFTPVSFRVNPEFPHEKARTLPPPSEEMVEEPNLARFYMAGVGLAFSNAALKFQMRQNAMSFNLYQYADNNPVMKIDPSGLAPTSPYQCLSCIELELSPDCKKAAVALNSMYNSSWQHYCDHPATHCYTCCNLTKTVSAACANLAQECQDCVSNKGAGTTAARYDYCGTGSANAGKGGTCAQQCTSSYPMKHGSKHTPYTSKDCCSVNCNKSPADSLPAHADCLWHYCCGSPSGKSGSIF
jgi:hypothetical protein